MTILNSHLLNATLNTPPTFLVIKWGSIHPFYDGNVRTGRIINVLYLVKQKLLNSPILMQSHKEKMRKELPKIYSQDLINVIFGHPYTKIDFVMREIDVSRLTATRYLNELVRIGLMQKEKKGHENYYINTELFKLFSSTNSE